MRCKKPVPAALPRPRKVTPPVKILESHILHLPWVEDKSMQQNSVEARRSRRLEQTHHQKMAAEDFDGGLVVDIIRGMKLPVVCRTMRGCVIRLAACFGWLLNLGD
jgi:hypothetical protein